MERDVGEGNLATAAASALAAAAVKAKVKLIRLLTLVFFFSKMFSNLIFLLHFLLSIWLRWKKGKSNLWWLCWLRPK